MRSYSEAIVQKSRRFDRRASGLRGERGGVAFFEESLLLPMAFFAVLLCLFLAIVFWQLLHRESVARRLVTRSHSEPVFLKPESLTGELSHVLSFALFAQSEEQVQIKKSGWLFPKVTAAADRRFGWANERVLSGGGLALAFAVQSRWMDSAGQIVHLQCLQQWLFQDR